MHPTIAARIRSLPARYPLTAWLALGFLSLHAAQLGLASAAQVLAAGLAFDLVTLAVLLPRCAVRMRAWRRRSTRIGKPRGVPATACCSTSACRTA